VTALGPSGFVVGCVQQPQSTLSTSASVPELRSHSSAAQRHVSPTAPIAITSRGARLHAQPPHAAAHAPAARSSAAGTEAVSSFASFREAQRARLTVRTPRQAIEVDGFGAGTSPHQADGPETEQQLAPWRGSSEHLMAAQHTRGAGMQPPRAAPPPSLSTLTGAPRGMKPPPLALHKLRGSHLRQQSQQPLRVPFK